MRLAANKLHLLLALWLMLSACQTAPQSEALLAGDNHLVPQQAMIADLPFYPQEDYQCGPAALATVLSHNSEVVTPDILGNLMFIPERQGTLQIEMLSTARSKGRVAYALEPVLESLLIEVSAGNPVIVFQNLGLKRWPVWHFAVVKGYSLDAGTLTLNSGAVENYELDLKTFERTWSRAGHWAIVALKPGQLPQTANPDDYFSSLLDFKHSFDSGPGILEAFEKALTRWPAHRLLGLSLAEMYIDQKQFVKAGLQLEQVLEAHPTFAPAHNNLAHVYLNLGQIGRARQHAEAAIAYGSAFSASYRNTLQQIERYTLDQ